MATSINSHDLKLNELERLSRAELRTLWTQELGDKPPRNPVGERLLDFGTAIIVTARLRESTILKASYPFDRQSVEFLSIFRMGVDEIDEIVGFADRSVTTPPRGLRDSNN